MTDACRDGRLRETDRLLAVDGHVLSEKSSLEDAVHWLQAAAGTVTLLVAHNTDSQSLPAYNSYSLSSSQPPVDDYSVTMIILPPLYHMMARLCCCVQ